MKFVDFFFVAVISAATATHHLCSTEKPLDVIFMVDSSGSVAMNDPGFTNWHNELDFVANIVHDSLPVNSRAALINFSGCSPGSDPTKCQKLKKMISLNEFGSPNDLDLVYDKIKGIGEDDYQGGYTWTDQALFIALNEFKANSQRDTAKVIVLLTDGVPLKSDTPPFNAVPCQTSTGYISETLLELKEMNVAIISVVVNVAAKDRAEFFQCLTNDVNTLFFEDDFKALTLPKLSESVGQVICDEIDGDSNKEMAFYKEKYVNGIPSSKGNVSFLLLSFIIFYSLILLNE